jgi:hypothetical protein
MREQTGKTQNENIPRTELSHSGIALRSARRVPPSEGATPPRYSSQIGLGTYALAAKALAAGGGTYPPIGSTSLSNAPLMMIAASRYHAVAAQIRLS